MKKILFIDDSPEIRIAGADLQNDDTKVFYGSSLYDADCYIYDESIDFDVMIIDFAVGHYVFSDEKYQKEYESLGCGKDFLVGWIWIKQYIEKNKGKANRIIGLSAYVDLLEEEDRSASDIQIIDKKDRDSIRLLHETVRRML